MKNALLVIFLFAFCACHKSGTTCIVCKTYEPIWNNTHTSFYEQLVKDTSFCNIGSEGSIITTYIDSNTSGIAHYTMGDYTTTCN